MKIIEWRVAEAVYAAARTAVMRARAGKGPTLIEAKIYRYRGHSRGDPGGYRRKDERAARTAQDPIDRLRRRLTSDFAIPSASLAKIETAAQARVELQRPSLPDEVPTPVRNRAWSICSHK